MTKTERLNHLRYWRKSGQTKKVYCDHAGIKYATFMSWFKLEEPSSLSQGQFIKLEESQLNSGYEIYFPNGIRVSTKSTMSIEVLQYLQSV